MLTHKVDVGMGGYLLKEIGRTQYMSFALKLYYISIVSLGSRSLLWFFPSKVPLSSLPKLAWYMCHVHQPILGHHVDLSKNTLPKSKCNWPEAMKNKTSTAFGILDNCTGEWCKGDSARRVGAHLRWLSCEFHVSSSSWKVITLLAPFISLINQFKKKAKLIVICPFVSNREINSPFTPQATHHVRKEAGIKTLGISWF